MKIHRYIASAALLSLSLPSYADLGDWNGWYVGADIGSIRQPETYKDAMVGGGSETITKKTASGNLFGFHGGYNNQVQQWVYGLEADLDKPNLNHKIIPPGDTWGARTETIAQTSIRPRIGYAFDRALIYGSAGVAVARIQNEYSNNFNVPEDTDVFTRNKTGWTSSAGVEYLLNARLALRGEYRYADFGKITNHPVKVWSGWEESHKITQQSIRAGIR